MSDLAWQILFTAFPRWDIPRASVALWSAELAVFEPKHLEQAARQLALDTEYHPTLAGWYQRAKKLAQADAGTIPLSPSEAWDEVLRNRRRPAVDVRWSSEVVNRAARAVEWSSRDWLTEQLPTIRAQFERYYQQLIVKRDELDAISDVQASDSRVRRLLEGRQQGKRQRRLFGSASEEGQA